MALIGIDEVGRGCWAGPLLVVAASARAPLPEGLTDSKLLSRKQREAFALMLEDKVEWGEGWVSPAEIDAVGLTQAMQVGVARALASLGAQTDDEIVMDGNYNYCSETFTNVSCVVKADATVPLVSAASIIAKVKRDAYMTKQSLVLPDYGFETHVGYGTKQHQTALKTYGITELHRLSFKPIRMFL